MKNVQVRIFFWPVFSPDTGKYGPEKTPYLDTFAVVYLSVTALYYTLIHSYVRSSHQRCSVKKVFLEILQNSQENNCARDSIKLQALGLRTLFYRTPPDGCF